MEILVNIILFTLTLLNFVSGDAIIGNGHVIIGVNDGEHLNVPYENVYIGMGDSDPSILWSVNYVGLRSGYGDDVGVYTATEKGNYTSNCLY